MVLSRDHPDLGGELGARLRGDHVEAPLDVGERLLEPVEVHRARAADPDRGHQRGEALDDRDLLGLVVGDDPEDRVDVGDRRQLLEGGLLLAQLLERARRRTSPLKPERPVPARMRRSQATDSVPLAWRLSTL